MPIFEAVPKDSIRPHNYLHGLSPDVIAAYRNGHSTHDIAKMFGCHNSTVRNHLLRAGVALRPVGRPRGKAKA